jgi:hypothetical protein
VSPSRAGLLAVIVLLGAFYAVFARVALHAFPYSGDEYSTVLQAELFARGELRAPAPPHAELLRVDHVIMDETVRSKYPPGASALLALGVRARVPWLVTPVEALVGLIAMAAAARRVLGEREAWVAVGLLGAAPLFSWQAASFYSHTATLMWLSLAFAAVAMWWKERPWALVLAGAAVGGALLTRPLDAVLFGVALLSFRSARVVAMTALGAAPFVLLMMAYQAAQFGSPFADGYHAYEPTFCAIYGAETGAHAMSLSYLYEGVHLWNHLDILRSFAIDWTVPGTALLAVLGWSALREPADAMKRFCAVLLALFVASLLVTIGGFDDGARPRYLSTALLPLVWLAAPGWRVAGELLGQRVGARTLRAIGWLVWGLPVIQLSAVLVERTPQLWVREGLEKEIERQGVREGVVIVRATYPTRYARNGPFFDRPVLYVSAPADATASEVAAAFPGRAVYEAKEGAKWSVVRIK